MSTYSALILAEPSLVNYWRCGDASPPLTDAVGGLSLAQSGSAGATHASLLTSDPGNASWLPASGVYIATGNYTFPSNFSLECWTDPTASLAANNNAACGAWNGSGSMFYFGGSQILSFYSGGAALTLSGIVGGIQHWVGTWDGTNRRIYLNGSLAAGPTAGAAPGAGGVPFQISGYSNSNGFYWNSPIDEVAVYNTALSASAILGHYNAGVASPSSGLVRSQAIII